MGRHTRPDDATTAVKPRLVHPAPGQPAATPDGDHHRCHDLARTAAGPRGVGTDTGEPAPVIEPIGPPLHVGWRDRRTARRQQAEAEALAARIARAQRRARQVSLSGAPAPAPVVAPVSPPRPALDAAPPWRSELPAPLESAG